MAEELHGLKVAFLVANEGVEQVELDAPWEAVERAGGEPVLIAPDAGEIQSMNHLDRSDIYEADLGVADAAVGDYAALVLPGGVANPDQLRTRPDAVAFVRSFVDAGLPVAAICHAPWVLVEADAVRGRRLTSWPSLQTDLRNAGAQWFDEEVVVCSGRPSRLITSRQPDDLPAFCHEVVRAAVEAGAPAPAR
jgi:protease I